MGPGKHVRMMLGISQQCRTDTENLTVEFNMNAYEKFLDAPPDDTSLWRYMDLARFLALIATSKLFLPSARTLWGIDPYEGALTEADLESLRADDEQFLDFIVKEDTTVSTPDEIAKIRAEMESQLPAMIERLKPDANFTYISCWHEREEESDTMWKAYGNSQGAIALKTTVKRLRTAIQNGLDLTHRAEPPNKAEMVFGLVKYIDFKSQRIPTFNNAQYLHKRKPFDSEKEVRAIVFAVPHVADEKGTYIFAGLTPSHFSIDKSVCHVPGLSPPVNLHELIEGVYISPQAPKWIIEPLVNMLNCFGLSNAAKQVEHSMLMRTPAYLKYD